MGNTLTGQIVAETYEALLKVTDNGIITGTKKRITDGFGNDTPLLLSSTDVQIDGNFLLSGTTLQYVRGDGSLATFPTIISTLTTTGSSGASTLIGSTLNIPNYTLTGLGGVPTSRTLTINGTTFDLSANRSWTITDTGLTSVGISMPSAFTVSNSPLTANGTIAITGAGLASQYVRGDGTLANFPTTGGGGSSVSYYFNGSVNQGTILGNVYREINKTPIIGAGTDFTINANGYIAQFITDANDPALLEIPAGNWNFEMFFSASSGGGSPSFYVELYKYNGTTFTLIASDSATPEGITNGTAIDLYTTALAVPQTTLTLTDRLAIRVYVTHSGRTITLHTENSHLCQVITTFSTGITALNSLTKQVQYLTVGTSGTDFAISSVTDTHTFNLPTASATNRGALSSADWTTFNGKESVLTFSSPLSRSVNTISIPAATTSINGYLTSTDWTTFNSKVPSTRTLTINGTAYDLSADRSWTIATGLSGSGTTNYVAKFTGTSSIGNSVIFDNGTNVGIGTASPNEKLSVIGAIYAGNGMIVQGYSAAAAGSGLNVEMGVTAGYTQFNSYNRTSSAYGQFRIDGSTLLLNVGSGGSVGINTTSPTYKLDTIGAIRATAGFQFGGSDGVVAQGQLTVSSSNTYFDYLGFLAFRQNFGASESMRILSNGNVGIGTTSPSNLLHLYGTGANTQSIRQESSISSANVYLIQKSASKSYITGLSTDFSNSYIIYDETASAMRLAITSAGNVGIGTATPSNKLQVFGSTDSYLANFTGASGGATARGLTIGTYTSLGAGDCGVEFNAAVNNTGYGQFKFSAGTNERMRIDSSGNVGIGTSSPSNKLHIVGGSTTTSIANAATTLNSRFDLANPAISFGIGYVSADIPMLQGFNNSTNTSTNITINPFGGNVGIGTTSPTAKLSVAGDINLLSTGAGIGCSTESVYFGGTTNGNYLAFGTNNAERMRIANNGNTALGDTLTLSPPSWYGTLTLGKNGTDKVVLGYVASSTNGAVIGGHNSALNAWADLNINGQNLIFRNAETERMRVASTGNVLIGSPTDNSTTAKLQVTGGISYQNIFNTQGASYTLALTDQSKIVETNVGSANNVTIPLDSSVNFPIGTEIQVLQLGAGQTTIVATSGVTTRSKSNQLKIANQNTGVTLVKRAANDWYVIGNLTA